MAEAATLALNQISRSIKASAQSTSETLKQHADSQQNSMERMLKDLYRIMSSTGRQISSLGGSFNENLGETQNFSRRLDNTNSLLSQTLSIQGSMLAEIRYLNSNFRSLTNSLLQNGNSGININGASSKFENIAKSIGILGGIGALGVFGYKASQGDYLGENANPLGSRVGAAPGAFSGVGSGGGAKPSAKEVYDYLIGKGLDHNQAMGMIANVARESRFDAGAFNSNDAGDGPSGGMFQHHDSRRDGSRRFSQMVEYAGPNWKENWRGQVDFALQESDGRRYLSERYSTPEEAAAAFYDKFERGRNRGSDLATSQSYLKQWEREGFGQNNRNQNQNVTPPSPSVPPQQREQPQQNPLIQNASYQPQQQGAKAFSSNPLIQRASLPSVLSPIPQENKTKETGQGEGGRVFEDQMSEAEVRKLPISPRLKGVLETAAMDAGVDVRVKSGGQPSSGPNRTGSTRHDDGNAADLDLYVGNKKLSPKNAEDLPIFKRFVAAAKSAGATGIGAGEGYMSPDGSRIHVGFGTEAIWGASKTGSDAASWLKDSIGGDTNRQASGSTQPQNGQSRADGINALDPLGMGGLGLIGAAAGPMGTGAPLLGAMQSLIDLMSSSQPQPQAQTAAYDPRVDNNSNNSYPTWYDRLKAANPNVGSKIMV